MSDILIHDKGASFDNDCRIVPKLIKLENSAVQQNKCLMWLEHNIISICFLLPTCT